MTQKTAQVPLPRLLLTEWRDQLASWIGRDYATGFDPAPQAVFDRKLNEAYEYISQRAAHEPWMLERTTLTLLAGTDTSYLMPASFRHLVAITETNSQGTMTTRQSTVSDFALGFTESVDQHPWENVSTPTWFFDSFNAGAPGGVDPDDEIRQQWRRIGSSCAGGTAEVLFRPFFGLLNTT